MRFDIEPKQIGKKQIRNEPDRIKHELKLLKLQTDCSKTIDQIDESLKWLRDIKDRLLAN